jgi:UDP-4-amino-4,6-dideoxy-N-acetyl-beta-L-altrosamine transaminase
LIPYGRHTVNWRDALAVAWQVKTKSLTQGSRIQEFEEKIANYVGSKYAVAVSSATAGLHISMLALDLPSESEVVTSPISFVASSNAILYAGLKPVFLDVDPHTINLSAELFKNYCLGNSGVKAIIPVHFAGMPCDMTNIHETANKFGIRIIEDAAHALGGNYESGEKIGSCKYSDLTVFSFHAVKSITTGEGGVITTNSFDLYQKLLLLRSHGITKISEDFQSPIMSKSHGKVNSWYYEMQLLGFHYRLTEIQAALGISQIHRLDKFMKKRLRIVSNYDKSLTQVEFIRPAQEANKKNSGNHIYPILIDFTKLEISKEDFLDELRNSGIRAQIHYLPIPLHPFYALNGFTTIKIPNALKYYSKCMSIPLFPGLSKRKQRKVMKSLGRIANNHRVN